MSQTAVVSKILNLDKIADSDCSHFVHFYPLDDELDVSLLDYIYTGLIRGETCIVISTPKNLICMNKGLRRLGINVTESISQGQFLIYDADEMLDKFMINESPDLNKFLGIFDEVMTNAVKRKKPIRIFGEMVSVLMKQKNYQAAVKLEENWNKLSKKHKFSLYCAYHESDFKDNSNYKQLIKQICSTHKFSTGNAF